jgi:hypothetical protein
MVELFHRDIWYHIATYFKTLKSFVRLWASYPALFRRILWSDAEFWGGLVQYFLFSRQESIQLVDVPKLHFGNQMTDGLNLVKRLFYNKKCSRSGCNNHFMEWENSKSACRFHPGKLGPTGKLSCCGGKGFRSPGCTTTNHDGTFYSMVHMVRMPGSETESAAVPVGTGTSTGTPTGTTARLPSITPLNSNTITTQTRTNPARAVESAALLTLPPIGSGSDHTRANTDAPLVYASPKM